MVMTAGIATFVLAAWLTGGTQTQGALAFSALPLKADSPSDNPSTPEKVALGRLLFWDPVLSAANDVACATCHHPRFGYADGRDLPIGTGASGMGTERRFEGEGPVPFVRRNSPSVLNAAFNGLAVTGHYEPATAPMFWDTRVRSLETQALEPLKALDEMRGDVQGGDAAVAAAVRRVAAIAEYRDLFAGAFGARAPVTATNMSRAIASFERSLVAADSPFDRYMRGDHSAMNATEVRGMQAFQDSGCANCHSGPMFSDFKTHVLGVRDNTKLATSDTGKDGTYAFRTPSLRNLASTGPYMHSGVARSLNDVVNFYTFRRGGPGGAGGPGPGRGGPGGPGRGGPGPGGIDNRTALPPGAAASGVVFDLAPVAQAGGAGQGGPGAGPRGQGGPPNGRGGRGGRGNLINPNVAANQLDPLLRRVTVRNRRTDIIEFLQALNSDFDRTIPDRVPSGLHPGGAID